jgi:hypothetical protein
MPTQDEYTRAVHNRIAMLAEQMLSDSIPYLEGCARLNVLLQEAALPDDDHDAVVFRLAAAETEHVPFESSPPRWSREAFNSMQPEIRRATEWARETTLSECESLLSRFGNGRGD